MADIKRSWLVQRLLRPIGTLDTPLSMPNDLPPEGEAYFRQFFTFDNMGAVQFEMGKATEVLRKLADKRTNLMASQITLDATPYLHETSYAERDVEATAGWVREFGDEHSKTQHEEAKAALQCVLNPRPVPVYLLAPEPLMDYARKFVTDEAEDKNALKEITFFRPSLLGMWEDEKKAGWIELDNGFMFFKDRKMFEGMADFYDVNIGHLAPQVSPARPGVEIPPSELRQ